MNFIKDSEGFLHAGPAPAFWPELQLVITETALPESALTGQEREIYDTLKSRRRKLQWLMGRAALKKLLSMLDKGEHFPDTSQICFPNPHLSISHSGQWAVAVGTQNHIYNGLGVDYEDRLPSPGAVRFYLTPAEQEWLIQQPEADRAEHRLRLWTVKEALFKADPDNHGKTYTHYSLHNPADRTGQAGFEVEADLHSGKSFDYFSIYLPDSLPAPTKLSGWISVARFS